MKCCFVFVSDGMMCIEVTVLNRSVYNGAPRGFGDLGRRAIYFQGAGGALLIILGELGSKYILFGI